jgi:hypothetical protein
MIKRIWRGWTLPKDADAYEALLFEEVFPGIAEKEVDGYLGVSLLRRPAATGEIEFMTVMSFESIEAVQAFAGDDYTLAYVPPRARVILHRFEETASHYEVRS